MFWSSKHKHPGEIVKEAYKVSHEVDLTFGRLTEPVGANQTTRYTFTSASVTPYFSFHLPLSIKITVWNSSCAIWGQLAPGHLRTASLTCWDLGWSRCCFCKGLHAHKWEHLVIDVGTLVGCIDFTDVQHRGEQCAAGHKVSDILYRLKSFNMWGFIFPFSFLVIKTVQIMALKYIPIVHIFTICPRIQ